MALRKLEAELALNASGFKKGMAEAAASTGQLEKGFSRLGTAAKGFLAAFTVGAIIQQTKKALDAQAQQEKAINSLNLALANQGNLTDSTSKSLQDYASALQDVTTFGDEAALGAMATLASFGQSEEQIKRTTAAAADFASATGADLQSATDLLGKAFAGNTAALSRYGIVIDESVPKAEKFEAVLSQVEGRFKGAAQADTMNFAGALKQLGNAFGDVYESVGKLFGFLSGSGDKPFAGLIEGAKSLNKFFGQDLIIAFSEVRARFAEFVASIAEKLATLADLGAKLPAALGGDKFAGLADTFRAVAVGQRELAAEQREVGDKAAAAAGNLQKFANATKKAAAGTKELTEEQKKWNAEIDKLSGKTAFAGIKRLGKQVSEVGLKNIGNLDGVRSAIESAIKEGALKGGRELPANLSAILLGAKVEIPDMLDLSGLEDTVRNLMPQLSKSSVEAARSFKEIAEAGRNAGISTKDLEENLKSAGASSDQAKKAIEATTAKTFDWQNALQGVALLAGSLGGSFGNVLQVVGNIGQSFKDWKTMDSSGRFNAIASGVGQIGGLIGEKHKKTGGALQGAAGGAMTGAALGSVVPGIGTVAGGVIGGVVGGIGGYLGGKKKEKEEKKKREEDFKSLTASLEKQFGSLSKLEEIAGKYGVSLKKALASKDAEKLSKELAELQKRQEGLKSAGAGIVALTQSFKPLTEQGAMAQAGLFSSVFWATVQREGLMAAASSLQPAFDALMTDASDAMKALLAPIGQQMALAGNEAFRSASEGASALGQTISGMMDAGIVSINDLRNAGVVAMEQYNAALGAAQAEGLAGAAAQEAAIRAVGPAVAQLLAGYTSLGIPLDENAMALKAAADATGMMFPQDAMSRAAESMERVALALEKAFGFSAGIASNAANTRFPPVPDYGGAGRGGGGFAEGEPTPGGGGRDVPFIPNNDPGFASGGIVDAPRSGGLAMVHGREAIVPLGGAASPELAGGGGGGASLTINAPMTLDPLQTNAAREDLAKYVIDQIFKGAKGSPLIRRLIREDGGR